MSTPELSLGSKLYKAATLSNFGTLFSIGAGIYGVVEDGKQWARVNQKLDQIITTQALILERLDGVYAEVQWQGIVDLLGKELKDIDNWFTTLKDLADAAIDNPASGKSEATNTSIKKLVKDVNKKCAKHLMAIDSVIMGRVTELSPPLMQVFADKIRTGGKKTPSAQSQYYDATSYFERWLLIQQKALILLGNAFKFENPNATLEDVMKELRNHTHRRNSPIFQLQAKYSKDLLEPADTNKRLEKYYWNYNSGANEGTDFVAIGLHSADKDDVFYLDTNRRVTDNGMIAVGLQLCGNGDRLAIKIVQAACRLGVVDQANPATPTKVSISGGTLEELFNKKRVERLVDNINDSPTKRERIEKEVLRHQQLYVNLSFTEVPRKEVMTGARLYLRGNWICIGIQAAKINDARIVDDASRHWIDAPSPVGDAQEEKDFFTIQGTCKYINVHPLIPKPLTPLRGVRLQRHDDGGGYRVNLGVKTGLCDIEDVWERYDVSTLASPLKGITLLLAEGYNGKVKLGDSYGFWFDGSGNGHPKGNAEFDLIKLGANKIGFRQTDVWGKERFLSVGQVDAIRLMSTESADSVFEWEEMDDGTNVLKSAGGKYLGVKRKSIGTYRAELKANQSSIESAERLQIVPV